MNLRSTIASVLHRSALAVSPNGQPNREQVIADAKVKLAAMLAAAQPRAQQYTRNRDAQKRRGM